MQTARGQGQQAGQKVSPPPFRPNPPGFFSTLLENNNNFRFWLSAIVIYPFVLFFVLFGVMLLRLGIPTRAFVYNAAGVLLSTTTLLVIAWMMLNAVVRERGRQRRELSRARCLTAVIDAINTGGLPVREKMKRAGRILAEEGDANGWRCRIVLEEDPAFLPPSGETLGYHLPMKAGDKTVGTLIVTATRQLDQVDCDFFDVLGRTMALFLYRENLWEDFHAELERVRASLLLNAATSPDGQTPLESATVEHMLKMIGLLHGKVENSVDNKL